jgi:choline dehydrogenase-like flavoprotein
MELQGAFDVTVLEAGGDFSPLGLELGTLERLKRTGLLRDERLIRLFLPNMRTRRASDGMVLVNGVGLGGTTTLCAGNGLRMDRDLKALGIDLDPEFESAQREIPIGTSHQRRWRESTRALFDVCCTMGLDPRPIPKMGDPGQCIRCGRCVLGCRPGVKWDSRRYLRVALERGARVVSGCHVERLVLEAGHATGVVARRGWRRQLYPADLVVLAAGGLGTPPILQTSGIGCEPRLFVDPVLCVAAEWTDAWQCREISMPFVVQRDRFIVSPYFDYLSFFFNPAWRHAARNTLPLMIKLADCEAGTVEGGRVSKRLTAEDQAGLREGVRLCTRILGRLGVREDAVFLGTLNAGHPGGMLPLTHQSAESFHDARLPDNVYVADASLFPRSLGNPPILTIVAMAKRVSRICRERCA